MISTDVTTTMEQAALGVDEGFTAKSPLPTGIETICLSLVAIVLVVLSFFGLVSVLLPGPNGWQDDASAATSLSEMRELKGTVG